MLFFDKTHSWQKNQFTFWLIPIGILVGILLRCCTSLHPYSGQNTPPMYGDYEAQRHWMEVTVNLPIEDWYRDTEDNDLMYWGLDYPPLTAYHSLACGYVAKTIDPTWVSLNASRGFESHEHKVFMRYTVIIADVLVYVTALCCYFYKYNEFKPATTHVKLKSTAYKDDNRKSNENTRAGDMDAKEKRKKSKNSLSMKSALKPAIKSGEDALKKVTKTVGFSDIDGAELKKNRFDLKLQPAYAFILALLYPGVILIDHGHFQYNCVSLGLAIHAVACVGSKYDLVSCIFFVLALNHKQMELYHSLPFFFYMLGTSLKHPKPLKRLVVIALTVIATFCLVWMPFVRLGPHSTMHVLKRLFPFSRGVFEDKVANFWCVVDVFLKLKQKLSHSTFASLCAGMTLVFSFPSCIDLLRKPGPRRFELALINVSFVFFLFSFHVHEKSILLVAIPTLFYFPVAPIPVFWFLFISTFSMLPLLIRDGLLLATISLAVFFYVSFDLMREFNCVSPSLPTRRKILEELFISILKAAGFTKKYESSSNIKSVSRKQLLLSITFDISLIGCAILTFVIAVFKPPSKLPDLFSLLIALYSFGHFLMFFCYFSYCQFVLPDASFSKNYLNEKMKKKL